MNNQHPKLFTTTLVFWCLTINMGYSAQVNSQFPEFNSDRNIIDVAIKNGDIEFIRLHLEDGSDINETWRDNPYQICRSLLLRSAWNGQPDIIQLLLENGANLEGVQEYVSIPVRQGNTSVVKILLEAGVQLEENSDILNEELRSASPEMLQLLLLNDLILKPLELSIYFLTYKTVRILIIEYLDPNELVYICKEACQIYELFDLLSDENHYCEGSIGPVWIHFVLTGDLETISYMLNSGAEVYTEAILPISFSALEAARALGDERMIQLLKQYTDDQ